jgi:hypothetical protein
LVRLNPPVILYSMNSDAPSNVHKWGFINNSIYGFLVDEQVKECFLDLQPCSFIRWSAGFEPYLTNGHQGQPPNGQGFSLFFFLFLKLKKKKKIN